MSSILTFTCADAEKANFQLYNRISAVLHFHFCLASPSKSMNPLSQKQPPYSLNPRTLTQHPVNADLVTWPTYFLAIFFHLLKIHIGTLIRMANSQ